jgi:hypothetical protein
MNPLALQVLVVTSHVPESSFGPSLLDWHTPAIPPLPKIDVHKAGERDPLPSPAIATSRK